jgi:hypothetical protein
MDFSPFLLREERTEVLDYFFYIKPPSTNWSAEFIPRGPWKANELSEALSIATSWTSANMFRRSLS